MGRFQSECEKIRSCIDAATFISSHLEFDREPQGSRRIKIARKSMPSSKFLLTFALETLSG